MTFDSIVKTFEKIKSEWNEDSRVDHEFRDKQYSTDKEDCFKKYK